MEEHVDGYGILVHTETRGSSRYRRGEDDHWDLAAAEAIAMDLLLSRRVTYVTIGDGEHEFRRWSSSVTESNGFDHPDLRWAEWFVDAEINGNRWRYRPLADLDSYDAADELAERLSELTDVTRIWVGNSEYGDEEVTETRDS